MKRAHENSMESTFLVLLISSLEEKEDIKGMNYVANSSELSKPSYPGNLHFLKIVFTIDFDFDTMPIAPTDSKGTDLKIFLTGSRNKCSSLTNLCRVSIRVKKRFWLKKESI